ncbi:MAG: hypothetical protein JXP34_05920 [Planctomycetes bacterium]|nr:hypothetical protein [Planctomycetota bacterium]
MAAAPLTASHARFQATDDGRLLAVLFVSGRGEDGRPVAENRILQVLPRGADPKPIRIDLEEPFRTFFLAYERGGSKPSRIIDIFGIGGDGTKLRYTRVRLR